MQLGLAVATIALVGWVLIVMGRTMYDGSLSSQRVVSISTKEAGYGRNEVETSPLEPSCQKNICGLHLAFIGDSVSRYQYLSLLHLLEFGEHVADDAFPSLLYVGHHPGGHAGLMEYAHELFPSNHYLCDGLRSPENASSWIDNRYYHDTQRDTSVTFITRLGPAHLSQGRWQPPLANDENIISLNSAYAQNYSFQPAYSAPTWRYDYGDLVREHLAKLSPRPAYVVINSGLWGHMTEDEVDTVIHALHENNMFGIYKTTTPHRRKTARPVVKLTKPDEYACERMDWCLDLRWTGQLDRKSSYYDQIHWKPDVNRRMNEQLLALLGQDGNQTNNEAGMTTLNDRWLREY